MAKHMKPTNLPTDDTAPVAAPITLEDDGEGTVYFVPTFDDECREFQLPARAASPKLVALVAAIAALVVAVVLAACSQAEAGGDAKTEEATTSAASSATTEASSAEGQSDNDTEEAGKSKAKAKDEPTFELGAVYAAGSSEVRRGDHLLPSVDEDAIIGVFAGTPYEVHEYVWTKYSGGEGFIPVVEIPAEQGIDMIAPTRIKNVAGLKYPDTLCVWGTSLMPEKRILEIRDAGQPVDLTHEEKLDNISRLADPLWAMAVNIAAVKAGVFTSFPADVATMYTEVVPYDLKGWENYSLTLEDGRTINGVIELKALAAASSLFYNYDTSQALWSCWRLVVVGAGSGANRFAYAPEVEYAEEGACVLVRGDLGRVRKVMAALGGSATDQGDDIVAGYNVAGGEFVVMTTCRKDEPTLEVARRDQPSQPTPGNPGNPSGPTPGPGPEPTPVPTKDPTQSAQDEAIYDGGDGDGADPYEAQPTTPTTADGDYKPRAEQQGGGTTAPSASEVESHAGTHTNDDGSTTTTTVNPGNGGNTPGSVTTDETTTYQDGTQESTWGAEAGGSVDEAPADTGSTSDGGNLADENAGGSMAAPD